VEDKRVVVKKVYLYNNKEMEPPARMAVIYTGIERAFKEELDIDLKLIRINDQDKEDDGKGDMQDSTAFTIVVFADIGQTTFMSTAKVTYGLYNQANRPGEDFVEGLIGRDLVRQTQRKERKC
jgi:hypothetical protein